MTLRLSPETWAQVRYAYEHTEKPVDDICLEHGVSPSTLRDRMRRWRWTRRHEPVSREGPPPMPFIKAATTLLPAMTPVDVSARFEPATPPGDGTAELPAPPACVVEDAPSDPAEVVPRLQGALARVLPAIEATLAQLATGPMPPREMERAARTLTALTRTLHELNALLGRYPDATDEGPNNLDEFRAELVRKIDGLIARRPGGRPPADFVPYGA